MPRVIKLTYKNHFNETVDFGSAGYYAGSGDIRDYEWTVTQKGNRISQLSRAVTTRRLPIVITAATEAAAYTLRNRIMEITEKDVLAMQPGKLICGGYYFQCYATASKKTGWNRSDRTLVLELTLTSDRPVWVKESSFSFRQDSGGTSAYLDFPYDFPFDYSNSFAQQDLQNSSFVGTDFRIDIFGSCVNPSITIADHIYGVTCELADGEYLTIDSQKKTVIKTAVDGAQTNFFNSRNKDSYIFEAIPAGTSAVAWSGAFDFDVTLLEERSEPKWT